MPLTPMTMTRFSVLARAHRYAAFARATAGLWTCSSYSGARVVRENLDLPRADDNGSKEHETQSRRQTRF